MLSTVIYFVWNVECRSPTALMAASEILKWQNHLLTWITQLQASVLENALSLLRKERTLMEQALPKQVTVILLTGKEQRKKKEMLFSKHSVLLPGSKVRPVLKKYHLELSITLPRDGIHDFLSKASFSVQPPLSFLTFHMKWSALIVLHYGGQLSCITPATHCVIIRNNVTMFLFTSLLLPFSLQVGAYKVGTDLLVEFEFRTTQVNGVLLGVSSQKMDGLGIELVDGKVSSQAALTPYNGSWSTFSLNANLPLQSQGILSGLSYMLDFPLPIQPGVLILLQTSSKRFCSTWGY